MVLFAAPALQRRTPIATMFARASRGISRQATLAPRNFATEAKHVRAPVQLYGLDGTYATSLYTAAAKNNTLDQADRSINSLKTALSRDAKLLGIISNPSLSTGDKKLLVDTLSSSCGADKTVKNFLSILSENNRLGLLTEVADAFGTLMRAHRGEVEATITSAQHLDSRTLSRLENAISKSSFIARGQKLKVVNKVNSDIMGGLVVEIGDRTIDLSVSSKISKLNKLLTDSV